jgi:hypothetical protein
MGQFSESFIGKVHSFNIIGKCNINIPWRFVTVLNVLLCSLWLWFRSVANLIYSSLGIGFHGQLES